MRNNIRFLAQSGVIAGLYALLTLINPLSMPGMIEIRLSEALTVLPIVFPSAIPGLAVGCLTANLLHGAMLPDVIFGTLATLIAAGLTRLTRKKTVIAALMPALCNGVIVGILMNRVYALNMPLALCMLSVFASEALVCLTLGLLLLRGIGKTGLKP